ncbi:hypothetical protein ACIQM0_18935 [Streptomyces sp. NPDC091387]|uniref:hypothetical protein n=1 Tax=Streptomyces sp. NPDC091387 TaxID=3365998 RepID=UPI00381D2285
MAVVGYALLLWRGLGWLDGGHLREEDLQPADGVVITGVRTALVALGASIVAGLGLYYTHKTLEHTREKDEKQVDLTREGQVTERYVEAIKLLGSDNLTQCLGGIYSLERIMWDSERDQPTIVEVLSTYIRTTLAAVGNGSTVLETTIPEGQTLHLSTPEGRERRSPARSTRASPYGRTSRRHSGVPLTSGEPADK